MPGEGQSSEPKAQGDRHAERRDYEKELETSLTHVIDRYCMHSNKPKASALNTAANIIGKLKMEADIKAD